jgi:hypothetical protein
MQKTNALLCAKLGQLMREQGVDEDALDRRPGEGRLLHDADAIDYRPRVEPGYASSHRREIAGINALDE